MDNLLTQAIGEPAMTTMPLTEKDVHDQMDLTLEYLYYDNYARVFGLCRILGLTNLYDIGCGNRLQAFFLHGHKNMFYTGIDKGIDFTRLNEFLDTQLFPNDKGRIKFRTGTYPFEITPAKNNAAILLYSLGMIPDEQSIKNIAAALSGDFERVLMNIRSEYFSIWEAELSDFTQYKIGDAENPFVFCTKFPEDISKLNDMGYNCFDSKFTIGSYLGDELIYSNSCFSKFIYKNI